MTGFVAPPIVWVVVARLDGRWGGPLKEDAFLTPIGTPMVGDMASVGDGVDDSEDDEQQDDDDDDDTEDEQDAERGDGDEGGDVGVVGSFNVNRGGKKRPPLNPLR